jgi:ubiquinone/menaquinone biosynthesis C-methylase UbiE
MNKTRAITNRAWWEKMVAEKNGFTQPWLDLDPTIVREYAQARLEAAPSFLKQIYPISILSDIRDKNVLCLAAGGGQQSAVFGILGANVTVFDIAEGQLEGDKKAAEHYGYKITTVQGDMSDLSALSDNYFDLVFQAPSMGYIPDVKQVYSEVARVLKLGGLYRADAQNPLSQFVDEGSWDGKGYRISVPYSVIEKKRAEDKDVIEYRHYLSEALNGLIDNGFTIERVEEAPNSNELYGSKQDPEPGTWLHSELYVPGLFIILARKAK